MSVDSALASARTAAESRMTSRCKVRRKGGTSTDGDGWETPGWTVRHADLPCFVDSSGRGTSGTRAVRIGDGEAQIALRVVKVPAATTDLLDGDWIEVTSGVCAGRVFKILEATPADQKKQQELPVVETQRPAEWT